MARIFISHSHVDEAHKDGAHKDGAEPIVFVVKPDWYKRKWRFYKRHQVKKFNISRLSE